MQSFISELENPIVQKDIIELGDKIQLFHEGKIDGEKFRALRLARGVYGQRQQGVQMIRIKIPFGKLNVEKLNRICDVSDKYSTGNLHITTRQDIQIHYVSLDKTPELWAELEKSEVTIREACGNTVRNITASATAGIDPNEPFDVSPYANVVFKYFLRKPFGQELGRKMKFSFSANDNDDAYSFIHDLGFIPKIKDGKKGFKVMIGGGLGAQPFLAQTAYEFLVAEEIIPLIEASIRVFDRHGERNSRHKARIKYLINKLGVEEFLQLVEEERKAVQYNPVKDFILEEEETLSLPPISKVSSLDDVLKNSTDKTFVEWAITNVFEQKQKGYVASFVKVKLGNFTTQQARKLGEIVKKYAADEIRFTIDQSLLIKYIPVSNLFALYNELKTLELNDSGYNSTLDVTSCPGTDTCNLGISNSTRVAVEIENYLRKEFPQYAFNQEIKIKISGCMNSCGQHGLAHIGFHGSSIKTKDATIPALQVLLGGGNQGNGNGRIADKVIKVPSKRVLDVVGTLLSDFDKEKSEAESFNAYYDRKGKDYFYQLLKPIANKENIVEKEKIDWGQEEYFKTQIGIGECAGVMIDLVATLIFDAEEKISNAANSLNEKSWADAIYHSYSASVNAAKAILLEKDIQCNTHKGIIDDFNTHCHQEFTFEGFENFTDFILQINKNEPSEKFAKNYYKTSYLFLNQVKSLKNIS